MMRRICSVWIIVLFVCAPASASADELTWEEEWPRFRVAEGIGSGVLIGGALGIRYGLGHPESSNWEGGILLDEPVRRALEPDSAATANAWGTTSDILTTTLSAYPFVVDSGIVAGGVHQDGSTAVQLAAMGVESFAVSGFVMSGLKYLVARQRPPAEDCSTEGGRNLYCSKERNESFPSGHTTLAFTGAGFICAAHENLDLFGGGLPDRAACWTALGLATGSGLSRIASGNHYLSDVAAGALIGVGSGYFLPKALHFGFGGGSSETTQARVSPLVGGNYRGISVSWRY